MCWSSTIRNEAAVPPKWTAVTPVNPLPVMVTFVPPVVGPLEGERPVTVGGVVMMTMFLLSLRECPEPSASSVSVATLPPAFLIVPPLRVRAVVRRSRVAAVGGVAGGDGVRERQDAAAAAGGVAGRAAGVERELRRAGDGDGLAEGDLDRTRGAGAVGAVGRRGRDVGHRRRGGVDDDVLVGAERAGARRRRQRRAWRRCWRRP